MTPGNILKEDRVSSTIHFINKYIRSATKKMQVNKVYSDYFVMAGNTVEALINAYQKKASKTALVIDDLGLQIINRLFQEGLKEITLCLTRIPAEQMNIVKSVITKTFPEIKVNIIHLNDIKEDMNFDLIIANPPYGKIGADITKKIIDTVAFDEYVNLLPANDYKRNTTKDLFNYQSDMNAINDGFSDAAVTTHVAKIHNTKVNNMTVEEFERSQYIDSSLDKYFAENSKRSHYAIDKMPAGGYSKKNAGTWDISKTFIIGMRDMSHKHMPYGKDCATYKWNVTETITMADLPGSDGRYFASNCIFNSIAEKKNFVAFVYNNFKFMSKVFTALNCDGTVHSIAFPKVDWTRSWTVEEILADYGYNADEIKEVMDDLVNFKGMED